MIDTVILRLHNLKKYETLVNFLNKKSADGFSQVSAKPSDIEAAADKEAHHVLYHDSSKFLRMSSRTAVNIRSSDYSLSCLLSFNRDFVEFNFSIPKYKYGTNVLQFVNYYEQNSNAMFVLFMDFIKEFCRSFIQNIQFQDLELVQLDLCYNQFFDTKESALQYQRAQVPILQKIARANSRPPMVLKDETLMLVLDRYTIEIYHKGTEFRKNDYRKLAEKGLGKKFDLDRMASIADRILRYEVKYKSGFLNYAFKKMYVTGSDFTGQKTLYRHLHKGLRIDKGRNRNKHFFFKSKYDIIDQIKEDYKDYCDEWGEYMPHAWTKEFIDYNDVTFDKRIFNCCYKHFWETFKKFQVNTSGDLANLKEQIAMVNEMEKRRNALSGKKYVKKNEKNLLFWAHLSQKQNLKELVKRGTMSKSAYYRVLKEFKKVGLCEYNPRMISTKPSVGYQDYKYFFGNFH